MGQKVHPIGLRIALNRDWQSKWYAPSKEFGAMLIEDLKIRDFVKRKLYASGVAHVKIERVTDRIRVTVYTARPGLVIGTKGGDINKLRDELKQFTKRDIYIEIEEIKRPELEAQLVAEGVAQQLEKRASYKRVLKRSSQLAMDMGALGIRIVVSGRLGGAEIARTESIRVGKVPLHTLRADIDFGFAEARTTYGAIGCKVWISRNDKALEEKAERRPSKPRAPRGPRAPRAEKAK